mgnify:CR=1 FL=1
MADFQVPTVPISDAVQIEDLLPFADTIIQKLGDSTTLGPMFMFAVVPDRGRNGDREMPEPITRLALVGFGQDMVDVILNACQVIEAADLRRAVEPPNATRFARYSRRFTIKTSMRQVFRALKETRHTVFSNTFSFHDMENPLIFGFFSGAETIREFLVHAKSISRAFDSRN